MAIYDVNSGGSFHTKKEGGKVRLVYGCDLFQGLPLSGSVKTLVIAVCIFTLKNSRIAHIKVPCTRLFICDYFCNISSRWRTAVCAMS